ncbi:hypothetical protein CC1G_11349 [Coprinopsis cinerea okayama7|uniref:Uncharacterized protein n=1 Tax=Coprinopsis cinerea (strain Okayama-7 / 130 / ATCC MYA-4618 / FGSC 9003) TaxID=240176 RepID=A8P8U7_COPC7|nr:hypothetical protein CC1G_11349 [Coprinopsis cinerea okayama7\|eukprot:XP_001839638.1 hypothetical protein CC1G_11349 [Coprinopsis cinerea okayama7\
MKGFSNFVRNPDANIFVRQLFNNKEWNDYARDNPNPPDRCDPDCGQGLCRPEVDLFGCIGCATRQTVCSFLRDFIERRLPSLLHPALPNAVNDGFYQGQAILRSPVNRPEYGPAAWKKLYDLALDSRKLLATTRDNEELIYGKKFNLGNPMSAMAKAKSDGNWDAFGSLALELHGELKVIAERIVSVAHAMDTKIADSQWELFPFLFAVHRERIAAARQKRLLEEIAAVVNVSGPASEIVAQLRELLPPHDCDI